MVAIAFGVVAALTVPPFDQGWLAWVALTPLLVALRGESVVAAAVCGALGGLTLFSALGYGTYAFDPATCALIIGGLAALIGVVLGATVALERATERAWLRPLILSSLWVLSERLSISANVSWSAALSQTPHLVLIQSAAVFGALWITFLLGMVNRTLALLAEALLPGASAERRQRAAWLPAVVMTAVAGAATGGYGWWTLARPRADEPRIRVAAIQPFIQTHEYRYEGLVPEYRRRNIAAVEALTAEAVRRRPDLLVWAEGGDGLFNLRVPARRERLSALARSSGAGLLISSYDLDPQGRLFNSVVSIAPDGEWLGRYDKVALTPVGEREFTAGTRWAPLPTRFGPVGPLVCFESIFSAPARAMTAQGAVLLLISTSDAAFRNSNLAALHARSAVYRAVENRRDVVQASNLGASMVVSASGAVEVQTPFFSRALLDGTVTLRQGSSPYAWLGDTPLMGLCIAVLLLAIADGIRRRQPAPRPAPAGRRASGVWIIVPWAALALMVGFALAVVSIVLTNRAVAEFPTWRAALTNFLRPPVVPLDAGTASSYRQRQPNTCGPAALAFLANYLGVDADEAAVLRHLTLTPQGTSLASLADAARALGFDAWGERQNLAALREVTKPVIAHIRDDHYVVVLAVTDDDHLDVFDPSAGYLRISTAQFEQIWKGNILLIRFK
jgi:apolipoprotein N-acyltransferase